jgi:Ca2+-transporting ATPase
MVGGQVMIIFVGGKAFAVTPLNGTQWAISIILGALSIPVAIIIRLIPDAFFARIFPDWMSKKKATPTTYATDAAQSPSDWNQANEVIREELSFLKMVRGGRLNQLRFGQGNFTELMKNKLKQYSGSSSNVALKDNPQHTRPRSNSFIGAGIAMGGVLGATIGKAGDWSPTDKNAQSVAGGTSVGQAPSTAGSRPVSQESSRPIAPAPTPGPSK